jgi:hypothetical protein
MMNNFTEFLEAIESGMDIETAAFLIGASPSAIFRLLERGKAEQDRLTGSARKVKEKPSEAAALELWVDVARRRAKAIQRHIKVINDSDDWKAHKDMLTHIHPAGFGAQGNTKEIEQSRLGEIEAGL